MRINQNLCVVLFFQPRIEDISNEQSVSYN